ncbi:MULTISPECIES: DUF6542 domain-containing protein [unclassified Nocardiopsis]|uniref:DUF6542 domain-containing protein n=1 Tax=unclassified Nocardiopsis TaxID=2649073 RepID=UPI00066B381B|nr:MULTISPECIES: DUF6542 domain-containing protein [unclassified Nocardiopsis]MBQ1083533.1 hypothetical protein [Nocardiopsis sp. B62]
MPPRKSDGPEPGQAPYFVRSNGRGREAAGADRPARSHPNPDRTARSHPKTTAAPWRPPRLTGRGGVLLIVVSSFAGTMIAHLMSTPAAPGLAFTLACLVTAALVRPGDLLSLSVSPPIAYFVAVVAAESLLALGNEGFARVLILGLASRLADVAPWLFLGTALVLVVAVFRGLPGNLRNLGDELNGRK